MHKYFAASLTGIVFGLCIANASSQELPAGSIEIRASTFVAKGLGEILTTKGTDFIVTLKREDDRSHSMHFSREPKPDERFVAMCMALQIAIDNGFAAIALVRKNDAWLVEYLKPGEESAGGGDRSPAIPVDSPEITGQCNSLRGRW